MSSDDNQNTAKSSLLFLYVLFVLVYVVLFTDLVVLAGHFESSSVSLLILHRLSRLLYQPFRWRGGIDFLEGAWDGPAIVFALASLGLLHYGITAAISVESSMPLMNKILNIFRLAFYVSLTLLVILIVVRMAVMTYHDITNPHRGEIIFGVSSTKK